MALLLKALAAALLLTTVALSAKQGWGMLTQPEPTDLLRKLHVGRPGQPALGAAGLLGAGLTLLLATFWDGSFLSAAAILLVVSLRLYRHHLAGAALEVPFLQLALLVRYLGHPLAQR